jgi:hypothetical protein
VNRCLGVTGAALETAPDPEAVEKFRSGRPVQFALRLTG